jgi:carbamoyl-phosphate synthase large subunit
MKSVGEVMAIGRCFEEALQKALRMVGAGHHGIVGNREEFADRTALEEELRNPTDRRLLAVAEAFAAGYDVEQLHAFTAIDRFFLHRIARVVDVHRQLTQYSDKDLAPGLLREAKRLGFSDFQIAGATMRYLTADPHDKSMAIRRLRRRHGIQPVVKQIDTVAGEFPSETNYLYMTYGGTEDDVVFPAPTAPPAERAVAILGSGPYRIGSSVEFDWCCVGAATECRRLGRKTIMINNNPETVSTDFDVCDRLYFEELTLERLLDIYEREHPVGFVVSMGGQVPNNLALRLARESVPVLGTAPHDIDRAEDRHQFSALLDELGVDQPEWAEVGSVEDAMARARAMGYPLLVRPSYVLSGAAMAVAQREAELRAILARAADVSGDHPVVMSRFIVGAKEVEIDAVADNGKIVAYAISEHIEPAGVHSGDATLVLPPQRVYMETIRRIKKIARKVALALRICGPFNMQFLARDNRIRVIECNLRASRSFPFCSKVYDVDFVALATRAILGCEVAAPVTSLFDLEHVGVKVPQFSFARLAGADPALGVEMTSTGEVACLGPDLGDAYLKAFLSAGNTLPHGAVLLSTGPLKVKGEFTESARTLVRRGVALFGTPGTADYLRREGIPCEVIDWPLSGSPRTALDLIRERIVSLVVNIPKDYGDRELDNGYLIRRAAVDFGLPLLTDVNVANVLISAWERFPEDRLDVRAYDEYLG